MLKNLMTLAAGAAILGLTVGCQPGTDVGNGTPADDERFVVGVSIPAADHGWTAGVKWWADEAKKNYPNIDWIIEDAKSPDEQITDLENLRSQNVDALVILATESAPLTPMAKQLHDAGILIINVDRGFTEPAADVFIEGDNAAFGRKSAEYMAAKLNGTGKIVVLEGIPSTVNTARVEAAAKVFAQYPGIEIVAQDSGMWNRETSEKVMQNILVANSEIDAIWASDDDMALGVENALRAAGRRDGVWILGGAGMKDIVKRVMDGDPLYPADITYPPSMIAVGIHEAASILRAGRANALKYIPKHIVLDVDLVTPDNAADYYFPESVY
jgi:ribose transport system substrate-binding protein